MNNLLHALYLVILVVAFVLFVLPPYDEEIPHEYNLAFYLNMVLLSMSILLENLMHNSVAKRLLVWLLYYEIVVPILFLYAFALQTKVKQTYTIRFYFVNLFFPGAYFVKITIVSICSFLRDTGEDVDTDGTSEHVYRTAECKDRPVMLGYSI